MADGRSPMKKIMLAESAGFSFGVKRSVEMAEKLGCPVYLYEGLGHSAYEEAKDFNSRILAFLQEKGSERTL